MKQAKWVLTGLALVVVLLLGVACESAAATTTPTAQNSSNGTNNIIPGGFTPPSSLGYPSAADAAAYARSLTSAFGQVSGTQQAGIWVTGIGSITLKPDLVLLNLGVETRGNTVAEANAQAAKAMTGIINALKSRGVADKDIQTLYFNIYPEYTYQEVYDAGGRYGKQILTGYRVSNTVTAKLRNLDIVGETIDDVVSAGGDATRINSIQFTVEDTAAAQTKAREIAVLDAVAKADQFATLTGATRGSLLFITETSAAVPVVKDFARMEGAVASDAVSTPISVGELEVQASIQAVFAIGD